ncbi:MAG: hypothetical protein N4A44_01130 [Alphaproteobacteria bacterium]|jgi:uncharacterized membrane protein|nr:hypothetical protein [Alphaproteobacteria bacterium]
MVKAKTLNNKKVKASNNKKKAPQDNQKIYHKYNIVLEVLVGLFLPIIAAIWLGNYYSDRAGTNIMLESLYIGLGFGALNTIILLHKEISRFYKNHHKHKTKGKK